MAHGSSVTYIVAPRRQRAGDAQGFDFGMRAAELPVPSFADDFAIANDRAADQRIRLDVAQTARGQFQRRAMCQTSNSRSAM